MSKAEEDKITPLKPPKVNKNKNPKPQKERIEKTPSPNIDTVQLKILIPVGIAIIIVAAVKYARVSKSILTVNIWWAHTTQPNPPIDNIANTIPWCPKSPLLLELTKIELDKIPKAGKIKI